jgi:hypothetical protein
MHSRLSYLLYLVFCGDDGMIGVVTPCIGLPQPLLCYIVYLWWEDDRHRDALCRFSAIISYVFASLIPATFGTLCRRQDRRRDA